MLALVVIPFANYGFEHRDKYKINSKWIHHFKIPVITFAVFAITASSTRQPLHKYTIRTKSDTLKIDVEKAVKCINDIAINHKMHKECCDTINQNGVFKNQEASIAYFILENDRGVRFEIEGKKGNGYFTEPSSFEEMRLIKQEL